MRSSGLSGLHVLAVTVTLGITSGMVGALMMGSFPAQVKEFYAPDTHDLYEESTCVLYQSTCPSGDFSCGSAPLSINLQCNDPRCTAPYCVPVTDSSGPGNGLTIDTDDEEDERNTEDQQADPDDAETVDMPANTTSGSSNDCVVMRFTCADGAGAQCFKRVRSKEVQCSDPVCNQYDCLQKSVFLSTRGFQAWDTGKLPGPFPRSETLCTVQTTSCPVGDTSCFSDISFSQISCTDSRCINNTSMCTKRQVSVDDKDNIILTAAPARSSAASSQASSIASRRSILDQWFGPTTSPDNSGPGNTDELRPAAETAPVTIDGAETAPLGTIRTTLGCYKTDGTWTTNRDECDPDQGRHITPPVMPAIPGVTMPERQPTNFTDPRESILRYEIEKRFFPDQERTAKIRELRASAADAITRLNTMLERQILQPDAVITAQETITWLEQNTSDDQTVLLLTLNDIQVRAEEVRTRLQQVQEMIAASLAAAGLPPRRTPDILLAKTDRIMMILPEALNVLLGEQIAVTAEVASGYFEAEMLYAEIRAACLQDNNQCARIGDVINRLEPVIMGMKQAIQDAGRPDVEERINLMFAQ